MKRKITPNFLIPLHTIEAPLFSPLHVAMAKVRTYPAKHNREIFQLVQ